jgi:hypothetical protein
MDLFNESLIVPSNLRFFLHRLSDDAQPSTNILKLNAMNSTSASSGGLITCRLPMALVDLNSFAMYFQTTLTQGVFSATGVAGVPAQPILPKGIEGLVSRMEVSVNGLGLLNLQNYNLLYEVLKGSHQSNDKAVMRRVLQNECDTAPIMTNYSALIGGASQNASSVFVSGATFAAQASAATLPITCTCGSMYSQLQESFQTGDIPYAALGITYTTITSAIVTEILQVPAFASSVQLNGTTNIIPADLVTRFLLTLQGTGIVASTSYTSTSPATFSVMVGSLVGLASTSCNPPTINSASFPTSAIVSSVSTTAPFVPVLAATQTYFQTGGNSFHCISDWLSFFKAAPNWIQLQMLGELEIRITLENNTCLSVPASCGLTTRPDYSLSNIFFTCRVCSFDNNFYDDILSEKLSSGGQIEIPYNNYANINQVQSAGNTSTRFSINSQSLNKVISCNRASYFNTLQGAMMHVPCGYGIRSDGTWGLINKGAFFATSSSAAPYTATTQSSTNTWQYQINNQFLPNIKTDPSFAYYNSLEAWNMHNSWSDSTISGKNTLFQLSNYNMSVALDFMDAAIPRLVAGVDTRGAVSVAYLLQDANVQGDRTDIFACFTSILKVGANQQIQVIF